MLILDEIRHVLYNAVRERRKGDTSVALALLIGGRRYIQAIVAERQLPDLAETIAILLSETTWEKPVTVSVQTGDGVTHILRTIGGRSRPAAQ